MPATKVQQKRPKSRGRKKVVSLLDKLPAGLRSKVRNAFSHFAKEMIRPPKHRR